MYAWRDTGYNKRTGVIGCPKPNDIEYIMSIENLSSNKRSQVKIKEKKCIPGIFDLIKNIN